MKTTFIKISISQDGLLPQQSIDLGETVLQSFPKKLMTALDFEKIDDDKKKTTFLGILPVFVTIGEKIQEIGIELTVAHPELLDKVVDIFTSKPPKDYKPPVTKSKPKTKKTVAASPGRKSAKARVKPKPEPKSKKVPVSGGKTKAAGASIRKKTTGTAKKPVKKQSAKKKKTSVATAKSAPKGRSKK